MPRAQRKDSIRHRPIFGEDTRRHWRDNEGMTVGVPKEVKDHEARVGVVPSGVTALREAGHRVLVQAHAGEGSAITDDEYREAGATIVLSAADVWAESNTVVKVSIRPYHLT